MNLVPSQPIQVGPSRPLCQRTPPHRGDQGDAPERSNPRPSNPPRLRSPRPLMITRRLRHLFKSTQLPQKSKKVNSPSASPAAIAIKATSNSWHRSPVWFAEEAPLTPTICGSLNPARWGARSATSSRYLYAELITVTSIASETKSPGGGDGLSIPSRRHGCSGFRRGVSNNDRPCRGTVRSRFCADSSR